MVVSLYSWLITFNVVDLQDETVTKIQIRAVIRAVAKWRGIVELLNTPENIEMIEMMEGELDRLMEGLGAKVNRKAKKRASAPRMLFFFLDFGVPKSSKNVSLGLFKLSNDMLKSLASRKLSKTSSPCTMNILTTRQMQSAMSHS